MVGEYFLHKMDLKASLKMTLSVVPENDWATCMLAGTSYQIRKSGLVILVIIITSRSTVVGRTAV